MTALSATTGAVSQRRILSPMEQMCRPAIFASFASNSAKPPSGPVTMAAKSHLRNGKPVVIALATNDGLSASAPNIAALLNRKNYYFVPFGQDNALAKPASLVADFSRLEETAAAALEGRQLQPLLL